MRPNTKFGNSPTNWNQASVSLQMEFVEDFEKSFTVRANGKEIYIPRSLVSYRRKWKEGSGRKMIEFTLPQWKVDDASLQKFVVP